MALIGEHDVVVIGGGLAGLTAGLFAARFGLNTVVLEPGVPGGQTINVDKIEDFPGFLNGVPGYDLGPTVQEQASAAGAAFAMAEVTGLQVAEPYWRVVTGEGSYRTKAVIVASGARPRPLGVPGEEQLTGRGVSHCASCDGPLYRGKTVGVVGSGDAALHEALTLAQFAARVIVFNPGERLHGQHTYQERVRAHPAIEVRHNTVVNAILGDDTVGGARVHDRETDASEDVNLTGIFVYVGTEPNTAFLDGVLPLAEGRIATDVWMRTARPGLFAAGDVRLEAAGYAVTGAGDGATAATAARRYVEETAWPA